MLKHMRQESILNPDESKNLISNLSSDIQNWKARKDAGETGCCLAKLISSFGGNCESSFPTPLKPDVATIHNLVHGMSSEVTFRIPGTSNFLTMDHFPPSRKMQIIAIDYDRANKERSLRLPPGGEPLPRKNVLFHFTWNVKLTFGKLLRREA